MSKQYGLILAGKSNVSAPVLKKASIFNDDSDSEGEVKKPTGFTKTVKRQDRLLQQQAIAEDPTVYQYDEVYDDMDTKRKESKLVRQDLDKKPKYINRLLVTAERRKRENERRIERQVQKEREEEGNKYKDKEEFVTSAYKKKLEELKVLEEEEKREEYLESIGDVKKQGDLSGFYRHLYDQKVNYGDDDKNENTDKKMDVVDDKSRSPSPQETKKETQTRKYRRRDDSTTSEDEEKEMDTKTKKLEHLPSNLDADSDFSIDSEDTDDEDAAEKKTKLLRIDGGENDGKSEENDDEKTLDGKKSDEKSAICKASVTEEGKLLVDDNNKVTEENTEDKDVKMEKKKAKIDIWKKRTVGTVFDEALQRYFERKSLRESA